MGRRVHLFAINSTTDWQRLIDLLDHHNRRLKCDDKQVHVGCFLKYQNRLYVECLAYTTRHESEALFSLRFGDNYYPPFNKPHWFHSDEVIVRELCSIGSASAGLLEQTLKNRNNPLTFTDVVEAFN